MWGFPLTRIFVFLLAVFISMYGVTELSLLTNDWLFVGQPMLKILTFEALQTVLILLVLKGMGAFDKRNLASYGLSPQGSLRDLGAGAVWGAFLVVLVVMSMSLLGVYKIKDIAFRSDVILALVFLSFAAFSEEIIFRGYILQTIEKKWGTAAGLTISSLLFGFAHMVNNVGGASQWDKALSCLFLSFEAGLPLAACYLLTRRLWMSIGMHWAWNLFEGPVFGTFVSGTRFGAPLITAKLTGPPLLTGGAFGPEGSLEGLIVGTALGVYFTYMAFKKNSWVPARVSIKKERSKIAPEGDHR